MFKTEPQQENFDINDLKSLAFQALRHASSNITEVKDDREENLERYTNQPDGREVLGRSSVQTSDVSDAINWILPQLMELFNNNSVEFVPMSTEDIEAAIQETEAVNYVIDNLNEGYLIKYTWNKDALLQKNGIVKVYVYESKEYDIEEYEGLSYENFIKIYQEPNISFIKLEMFINGSKFEGDLQQIISETPPEIALQAFTFNCQFKVKEVKKHIKIENIAPENFFVNSDHKSLDLTDAAFVAQVESKYITDLIAEGFDEKILEQLPTSVNDLNTSEAVTRNEASGITSVDSSTLNKRVDITECYIKYDIDGDQYPETIKMIIGGNEANGDILHWEVVSRNPYFAITPEIMPHRFYGRCPADLVKQVQDVKTFITRQILDNLALQNNPKVKVNINLLDDGGEQDIQSTDLGGFIRVKDNSAVDAFVVPFVAENSLSILNLFDDYAERKTGVSKLAQGLDPALLKDQSMMIGAKMINASMQKILGIARTFAETGYKQMFKYVHELMRKYIDKDFYINLRGEYVQVDPRKWGKRSNIRVMIGTGNSTQEMKISALTGLLGYQEKIVMQGGDTLVDAQNIYNTLEDLIKLSGIKNVDRYIKNPEKQPPVIPEPEPIDPTVELGLKDIDLRKESKLIDVQADIAKAESEANIAREKIALEKRKEENRHAEKMKELGLKEVELAQNEKKIKIEEFNSQLEAEVIKNEMEKDEKDSEDIET